MFDTSRSRWHPIAASSDLVSRHVFHGQLLGRDLAIWRADDGHVNVWENRCLHRGVRLSIGINDGRELKCQYHGWRYANRTAACTYIPAHPADAPARTITNRVFPAVEKGGLVWSCEEPTDVAPRDVGRLEEGELVLRGRPVKAPADIVQAALRGYQFQPNGHLDGNRAHVTVEQADDFSVVLKATADGEEALVTFFIQPVDSDRSVIRGIIHRSPAAERRIAVLRHHDERLSLLRETIERQAAAVDRPRVRIEPSISLVSDALAELPALDASERRTSIRAVVSRKWMTTSTIAAFELKAIRGALPAAQPGAHIDINLPNGQVRQYSIVNAAGGADHYAIGVKLAPQSRGGSACLHDVVREGDVLAISAPRNNFPLRRDAIETILVASGIGVTPLLSMAEVLKHNGMAFHLHYFVSSGADAAFAERLEALRPAVTIHATLSPQETEQQIQDMLRAYRPKTHVYVCGPHPMVDAALSIGSDAGWPDEAVHFEHFENTRTIDDSSSFEIALARSSVSLQVPAGKTILDVLREHGIDMPSSCEQGACGTCVATVIDGTPDHQDVYLSNAEKKSCSKIMTCVSRSLTPRLVLDL